jgi:hypothetical protein
MIQKRERVARRMVFVGMFGVISFGMLPDLFLLFLEARAFLLKTALVLAIQLLIWRPMQKTFFKWLVTDAKEDIKKGQSLRRRVRAWLLASGVPKHKLDEATDEFNARRSRWTLT